jgi:hypothetical protein
MTTHVQAAPADPRFSRRAALGGCAAGLLAALPRNLGGGDAKSTARSWLRIRGIYGGFPREMLAKGQTPADYGINAIWVGSGSLDAAEIERYHTLGVKVFAEFNSLHAAQYLKDHPDAAPIGVDGKPSPPPQGWQGVSPFHAGYRRERMHVFEGVLRSFAIDGIWLDYHHAHASWERADPEMPDTDFCPAALAGFTKETGIDLPADVPAAAKILLGERREAWTSFRCGVLTDWVREYRAIVDVFRPKALIGTFHCPWSPGDYDGAIRHKLAIDLKSQAKYLDIFSIMPYHARFGHAQDLPWIARQIKLLGEHLGLSGKPDEKQQIWPIVQLSDWGERVVPADIGPVLEHASRTPATGVMGFHWNALSKEWDKVEAVGRAYRSYA